MMEFPKKWAEVISVFLFLTHNILLNECECARWITPSTSTSNLVGSSSYTSNMFPVEGNNNIDSKMGNQMNYANCPVNQMGLLGKREKFDLHKFLGHWNVLEYMYPKPTPEKDLSCIGFHFTTAKFDNDYSVLTNFTFRFPTSTGFFYYVPTFHLVSQIDSAVWETQYKGADLLSIIADTDYENWAVQVQCSAPSNQNGRQSNEEPRLLSIRVLSRGAHLNPIFIEKIDEAIHKIDMDAPFKYPVNQDDNCQMRHIS